MRIHYIIHIMNSTSSWWYCVAGGCRAASSGPAYRCIPVTRRGWTECQQDRECSENYAHTQWLCGVYAGIFHLWAIYIFDCMFLLNSLYIWNVAVYVICFCIADNTIICIIYICMIFLGREISDSKSSESYAVPQSQVLHCAVMCV